MVEIESFVISTTGSIGADVAKWIKAVVCESTMRGFNSRRVAGFFLPIGALPSPPPWGWSTGFITTPLTTGRLPSQHLDPALPKLFWFTPTLPTCNFNVADFPSFAISFATAPAALANCPPFPSVISMLCMAVPKGISVEVDSSF
ncbi:Photosystem II protein D1 [Fagus crenata]